MPPDRDDGVDQRVPPEAAAVAATHPMGECRADECRSPEDHERIGDDATVRSGHGPDVGVAAVVAVAALVARVVGVDAEEELRPAICCATACGTHTAIALGGPVFGHAGIAG